MAKLWQKDYQLNELIEAYTVGRDDELDLELVGADAIASMAQARQLERMRLLEPREADALVRELAQVIADWNSGSFVVSKADEDCHTAIENRLTEKLGDLGKKIHTGRSRNDQVITAVRVWARGQISQVRTRALELVDRLIDFAETHRGVPMPGRTHMQTGMPSSVGLWAASWAEELLDTLSLVDAAYRLVDQSSLGSAASYGVPLPLDREYIALCLGFARVQQNVLYVNNSRGKFESIVLDALDQIGLTLSKMAQDLILFSLPEFGYFRLPKALCSGSSIMPQKRNPDALELMRAKSATLSSYATLVKNVVRSLPSGYNRDFQETKEPFVRGLALAKASLGIMSLTIEELEVVPEALKRAFTPDIFATDAAYELVRAGSSFRDAYREVGLNLSRLDARDPEETIANRTHTGAAGNLGLDADRAWAERLRRSYEDDRRRIENAVVALAGERAWKDSGL